MNGVAILGLACRLPGAPDWAAFQDNLVAGRSSLGPVPPGRWDRRRHPVPPLAGFVDGVELFDNAFFGITPREARMMDPQQRLLLEEAVHCMEDAGVAPGALRAGRTAVFVAAMGYDYYQNVAGAAGAIESHGAVGVHLSLMANRISHVFGLRGESVALDAACAGSLVALHQARRALLAGECDHALVGAVNLNLNPWRLGAYGAGHLLSPGGGSAAFDAGADGFIPGEGVVVLLLRRQTDAVAAGQRAHAVLLGSATGHVGGGLALTAPSIASERDVIERAAAAAGVGLETVGYVEAHGTGTSLGDPIEIEALNQAFAGAEPGSCLVGSVKTNIGHLEGAAGLAGVAKVLTMLRLRRVLPTLGLRAANPLIDFEAGAMRPAMAVAEWAPRPGSGGRLRAGVSSFGFGGAVAHAIFEEAETVAGGKDAGEALPFLLSAHSPAALAALWARWQGFATTPGFAATPLADMAGTLARGRAPGRHRLALVVRDHAELRAALAGPCPAGTLAAAPVIAVRADWGEVGTLRACLPHPAWVSGEAAGAGWAPAHPVAAVDLPMLRQWHAGLGAPDAAAAAGLLRQARGLAAGNYTFRAYLEDWQRVIGGRGSLAGWLDDPPQGAEGRLLVLVLLTALRRLSRKWALPAGHAALGPAWGEVAEAIVGGILPDAAVLPLIDGTGLEALATEAAGISRADIEVVLDRGGIAAGEARGLVPVLAALWVRGADVDWGGLPFRHATVTLPAYPFEPHWHWLPLAGAQAGEAPLAAGALALDHVIEGRPLVPAASMMLALGHGTLRGVSFLRRVGAEAAGRLAAVARGEGMALLLDGAEICTAERVEADGPRRAPASLGGEGRADRAVYARFETLGYRYGPALQVLLAVAAAETEVVCRMRCGGDAAVALDGVLQACLVAADRWGLVEALVYPAGLERAVLGVPPDVFEVRVARPAMARLGRGFVCDVRAEGAGAEAWAEMQGVRFAAPAAGAAAVDVPAVIREAVAAAIDVAPAEIGDDAPFAELGVDSILAADVARAIGKALGTRIPLHVFSDHPTPAALARHLAPATAAPAPSPDLAGVIREAVAAAIDVAPGEIGDEIPFFELGVDSILAADVARAIGKALGTRIPLHVFSDHPTPAALARHLAPASAVATPEPVIPAAPRQDAQPRRDEPVAPGTGCAIIGMAGRFPGARDLDAYWSLLHEGRSAIGPAPGRWGGAGGPGGFLEDAERFDAAFFGISPREALLMDPQERVLLEQAWVALADAGLAGGAGGRGVGCMWARPRGTMPGFAPCGMRRRTRIRCWRNSPPRSLPAWRTCSTCMDRHWWWMRPAPPPSPRCNWAATRSRAARSTPPWWRG